MVTSLSLPYFSTGVMHESIVESVKAFISTKFIKAQHFKHHGKCLTKKGIAYIMHTFIF